MKGVVAIGSGQARVGGFRRSRQGGVVLVLYAIGALGIIAMAGLALDLGIVYLTKTRLQNAVDAAALDGAKTLFGTHSFAEATTQATTTLSANITLPSGVTPAIHASVQYEPFSNNDNNASRYVKVTVSDLTVPAYLTRVLGIADQLKVGASALAGPQFMGGTQCGVPIGLCGNAGASDKDCTDGSCYDVPHLPLTNEILLKESGKGGVITPGNWGLLNCGTGANCVGKALAGEESYCFTPGATDVDTQTGQVQSIAKGLNTRFGVYAGGYDQATHPPDRVTALSNMVYPVPTLTYSVYLTRQANGPHEFPNGVAGRRTALAPIIDCSELGPGHTDVNILDTACVFFTRQVDQSAGDIYIELIDTCLTESGTPTGEATGAARIVLFQTTAES